MKYEAQFVILSLFAFKIQPCSRKQHHDATTCKNGKEVKGMNKSAYADRKIMEK